MPQQGSEPVFRPACWPRRARRTLRMQPVAASRTKSLLQAHHAKAPLSLWSAPPSSNYFLRWFQAGALGEQQAQGCLAVVLAHGGLEVGGRQIFWMGLMGAPLHEEAVADAPEQAGHQHGVRMANPATIIVMGNVQTLVQAVFDAAKTSAVEFQPLLGVEPLGWSAGDEADIFILAALGFGAASGRPAPPAESKAAPGRPPGSGSSGSRCGPFRTGRCDTPWASASKGGKSALGAGSSFSMFW